MNDRYKTVLQPILV